MAKADLRISVDQRTYRMIDAASEIRGLTKTEYLRLLINTEASSHETVQKFSQLAVQSTTSLIDLADNIEFIKNFVVDRYEYDRGDDISEEI